MKQSDLNKILREITAKLEQKKESLIKLRVKEKTGVEVDLIKEVNKRFSRICSEFNSIDQVEHWYWNDGSEDGLLLITFYFGFEQNFMNELLNFNSMLRYS